MKISYIDIIDVHSVESEKAIQLFRNQCKEILVKIFDDGFLIDLQDQIGDLIKVRPVDAGADFVIGALANYAMLQLVAEIIKERKVQEN